MTDVSHDDADEEEEDILHGSPIDDDDVFLTDDFVAVANPGILSTCTANDSLTQDVLSQDVVDLLARLDKTRLLLHQQNPLEVTIPLRIPTHPTLVTGKTAEKCDNAEVCGQSDLKTSPKKGKSGSRCK